MNLKPESDALLDLDHLHRLSEKPDRLRALIDNFLTTTPPILQELEQRIQRRDEAEVQDLLHALSGAAQSAGAKTLAQACKDLSQRWQDEQSAGVRPLEAQFQETGDALVGFSNELPVKAQATLQTISSQTTVLLVEDNSTARELVRLALEEDYKIFDAENGHVALALCENEGSLGVPGMDKILIFMQIFRILSGQW